MTRLALDLGRPQSLDAAILDLDLDKEFAGLDLTTTSTGDGTETRRPMFQLVCGNQEFLLACRTDPSRGSMPDTSDLDILFGNVSLFATDITGVADRDDVLLADVVPVMVQVIDEDRASLGFPTNFPYERLLAPVTAVDAWSQFLEQIDPVYAHATTRWNQRVVGNGSGWLSLHLTDNPAWNQTILVRP